MATKSISLKQRMAKGELTIGSWLSFGYPQLAEMMAKAGFDWVVVDMEHSATSASEMLGLIQTIDLAGSDPLVRVGNNDPLLIKRSMDAGARGVIAPMVCTVEDAKRAVDAVYYPTRGSRGVGLSRAQGFGMEFDAYRASADETFVVVAQIEHFEAVNNLEAILDVDGVDGFIVGPYDLSGSLGVPGQFDHPDVISAMDRIQEIIRNHPKPGGFHIVHSDQEDLKRRVEGGCRFIAYGTEMIFLAEKLRDEGAFLKGLRK